MGRSTAALLATAFVALAGPAHASGQLMIEAGGGVTIPLGAYADFNEAAPGERGANPGWLSHLGVALPISGEHLAAGVAGFFGSNGHDVGGDKTNLYGGWAGVRFALRGPDEIAPFLGGQVGVLTRAFRSDTQPGIEEAWLGLAVGASGGVTIPVRDVSALVEARWLRGFGDVEGTQILALLVGVRLALGGGA